MGTRARALAEIASEGLKGRGFEMSLADLNNDEDQAFRKIKLVAEDVQGYNILTNFHGMDMTRDKLSSLIKKWQTLIEAHVDVRTTDNYTLRLFCVAFTTKMGNQVKKTCYAQSAQIREIRKKMTDIMREEASKCELKDLVLKLCVPGATSTLARSLPRRDEARAEGAPKATPPKGDGAGGPPSCTPLPQTAAMHTVGGRICHGRAQMDESLYRNSAPCPRRARTSKAPNTRHTLPRTSR